MVLVKHNTLSLASPSQINTKYEYVKCTSFNINAVNTCITFQSQIFTVLCPEKKSSFSWKTLNVRNTQNKPMTCSKQNRLLREDLI